MTFEVIRKVVVDPGHGMANRKPGVFDPGAVRLNGNGKPEATEAALALAYGVALADALTLRGFETILTRNDHKEFASLARRLSIARGAKAAAFISVHCNAAPAEVKGRARGHEALYGSTAADSDLLARAISLALRPHIPPHGSGVIFRPGLAVLRYERLAVLVELGFLDHDGDYALLSDARWKLRVVDSIADAVKQFFDSRDRSGNVPLTARAPAVPRPIPPSGRG